MCNSIGLFLRRTLQLWVLLLSKCFVLPASEIRRPIVWLFHVATIFLLSTTSFAQVRDTMSLNNNWKTALVTKDFRYVGTSSISRLKNVQQVNVPHNWDDYYGYRRLVHGNLHGNAFYEKTFTVSKQKTKRYLLFFEGVGSFATVWVNGKQAGKHSGGRTTFTLDISSLVQSGANRLAVLAEHPANIQTLPWVCGGCSDERGFSEGSQPLGIFRPVHLITTNEIRIMPFGVHAWADIKNQSANLHVNTIIKNSAATRKNLSVSQSLLDKDGNIVASSSMDHALEVDETLTLTSKDLFAGKVNLWSIEHPYLYKIRTRISVGNNLVDEMFTDFGFRTIAWRSPSNQFFLNGKPVFINGVAGYEHLIGQSHAFSHEQIVARIKWLQAAGFNAFRDAHQPHNLLYGKLFNEKGILWWTQMSAHIWYDTPEFRNNFKELLREWVIERRNDPSVVMWGLQNESKLPKDFAAECTELIRSLDPTAATERLVTTCNGGEGTDWDVPQNWTGTYGGNPDTYGNDLKKQILVGEYGAWRTLDLHTEGGFNQNGPVSEDRFAQLLEKKIRLAESVKDSVAGHFFWLLTSHDNPGRVQGGEGLRELDRIGPVNYKGMLTPWEEPTDAFYMFRSNYVATSQQPMVYIASHTWPNRWITPGIKDSITVYSNCDEVELFNDIDQSSLGRKTRNGMGTSFLWNKVNIQHNILYAVGYVNGKPVARDTVVLFHLPKAPEFNKLYRNAVNEVNPQKGLKYVYRVNCGGPNYKDHNGNWWTADRTLPGAMDEKKIFNHYQYSKSWAWRFPELPANFASQRRVFAPIANTTDWALAQTFRYGKNDLQFEFPISNGQYSVELYFIEPWVGLGGADGNGMRVFDVAFNNKIVLNDLDIWKEAGSNRLLKKVIPVTITNNHLSIHFPETKAGQAIISAIAIAGKNSKTHPAPSLPNVFKLHPQHTGVEIQSWLDIGNKVFRDASITFNQLPPALFGADWLLRSKNSSGKLGFSLPYGADLFIAIDEKEPQPASIKDFENTNTFIKTDEKGGKKYLVYKKRCKAGTQFNFSNTENWLIAALFESNMQPAYDLKPVTTYNADVAIINEHVSKEVFSNRERTVVKDEGEAVIEWPVKTGVADVYSIKVKYYSSFNEERSGVLQLIDVGNNKMVEESVSFKFTKTGKWNFITTNTGNMINAGNYKVRLLIKNAKGLVVSNIEIQ